MILCLQTIFIAVLIFTLIALYLDERRKNLAKIPKGKLTSFWEGSERRRHVRVDADVSVRYYLSKGAINLKDAKTKNISAGGICISVKEKLNTNDALSLEIDIVGSSGFIAAVGNVVWVKEDDERKDTDGIRHFNIGLEFKNLAPNDRNRLFNFIKEHRRVQVE